MVPTYRTNVRYSWYCTAAVTQHRIYHSWDRNFCELQNFAISQGTKRLLRMWNSWEVSRLESVLDFLLRSCFLRVRDRYFSICWGICRIRGADTCLVKLQPWIFLLNLLFYISQVFVACGVGGSCEFVSAASAKVEIWRIPVLLRFFYPMQISIYCRAIFLLLPLKGIPAAFK